MRKYYFIFGKSKYNAFKGGWVRVDAIDVATAIKKFTSRHSHINSTRSFVCIYDEECFKKTEMYKTDNLGSRCHEVIE